MAKKQGDKTKIDDESFKKASSVKNSKTPRFKSNQVTDEVLDDIHKKIISSSALNGGFDILMFKIEKIEQNQEALVEKVDKIHDAIYDPDDGIFSKMNSSNISTIEKINETDQRLIALAEWKKRKEKDEEKIEESVEESSMKLSSLQKSVDDLQKSKNIVWNTLRWILVAIAGGSLTLMFKWLENKL